MEFETCGACGARNESGASFCAACGASLEPRVHCPTCNTLNAVGQRHCTRCGGSLEQAAWSGAAPTGAVIEGVWERGADEVIRRVDPEDARRYLGTRTVRVPAGTVGVVVVDGVIERVVPPGERTTLGWFERIASFFLRRERTAFYLVDQRPILVPFVVRTRTTAVGHAVRAQVLATLTLPRGDRAALAMFIANVLGDRPAFTTGNLYDLLRPEVARIAQDALERRLGAELSYADAEAEIRSALAAVVGPRYGLTVDATLAPLTAVASTNVRLGAAAMPAVRTCPACATEVPVSLAVCDHCGTEQPAPAAPADDGLFTSDGQRVELDLVVRVQGQHDDFTPERIEPAIAGPVAAHLRGRTFAELVSAGGFAALEQAAGAALALALRAYGMTLVELAVVDARSHSGQWVRAARAELERAVEDVRLGLAWLEQRDSELDLEQLVLARVLRQQAQQRDHAFARDDAATADRERRDELARRDAVLDAATVERARAARALRDAVEHEARRVAVANASELRTAELEAELAAMRARRDLDFAERQRVERFELELAAAREAQQLDKLRAMAELDRVLAAQEHAHALESRTQLQGLSPEAMIAIQATELARGEGGGAAWANALGGAAERRHAVEMRALLERQHAGASALMDRAMAAMAEVARSRAEAAPIVAGGAPVVTVAGAVDAATRPCASCRAPMRLGARFCESCGAPATNEGGAR